MRKVIDLIKRGDTIIEVTFAIMVFSLIAVLSVQIMDRDVSLIQASLESEMARNEIDAQAEALRYIQNAYLSERELANGKREYEALWLKLSRATEDDKNSINKAGTGLSNLPESITPFATVDCKTYYDENNNDDEIHNLFKDRAFVINARNINPANVGETIVQSKNGDVSNRDMFTETGLYPRVLYTKKSAQGMVHDEDILAEVFPTLNDEADKEMQVNAEVYNTVLRAEGIWVIATRANNKGNRIVDDTTTVPEFYDFHIRTCWYAPGRVFPSSIATTIRLYNPEYIEGQTKQAENGV